MSLVGLFSISVCRANQVVFKDPASTADKTTEEQAARSMIEKKSVINLLEAFAVSLKHYLRGEDGIFYEYDPILCGYRNYVVVETFLFQEISTTWSNIFQDMPCLQEDLQWVMDDPP